MRLFTHYGYRRFAGEAACPAAAFLVEHVDYRWQRGAREPLGQG